MSSIIFKEIKKEDTSDHCINHTIILIVIIRINTITIPDNGYHFKIYSVYCIRSRDSEKQKIVNPIAVKIIIASWNRITNINQGIPISNIHIAYGTMKKHNQVIIAMI